MLVNRFFYFLMTFIPLFAAAVNWQYYWDNGMVIRALDSKTFERYNFTIQNWQQANRSLLSQAPTPISEEKAHRIITKRLNEIKT